MLCADRGQVPHALLLGRTAAAAEGAQVGFTRPRQPDDATGDLVTYSGDAPLITIAATGTGKTSGPVICNARTYPVN